MTSFQISGFGCHCQTSSRCRCLMLSCMHIYGSPHTCFPSCCLFFAVKCDSSVLQNLLSMGGTLECLAGLFTGGGDHHGHKNKTMQLQTVDLKVRMDCEGCELKVKNALSSLKGVESVEVSRKQQKVTVAGYVDASKVLKRAQSTGKKAELWPHVPYGAAYDRRAPPGHVRNAEASAAYVSGHAGGAADRLTNLFNDDDPNSCSVM